MLGMSKSEFKKYLETQNLKDIKEKVVKINKIVK